MKRFYLKYLLPFRKQLIIHVITLFKFFTKEPLINQSSQHPSKLIEDETYRMCISCIYLYI